MKILRMAIVGSGHMASTYSHCLRYHNTGVKLVARLANDECLVEVDAVAIIDRTGECR